MTSLEDIPNYSDMDNYKWKTEYDKKHNSGQSTGGSTTQQTGDDGPSNQQSGTNTPQNDGPSTVQQT